MSPRRQGSVIWNGSRSGRDDRPELGLGATQSGIECGFRNCAVSLMGCRACRDRRRPASFSAATAATAVSDTPARESFRRRRWSAGHLPISCHASRRTRVLIPPLATNANARTLWRTWRATRGEGLRPSRPMAIRPSLRDRRERRPQTHAFWSNPGSHPASCHKRKRAWAGVFSFVAETESFSFELQVVSTRLRNHPFPYEESVRLVSPRFIE